MNLRVINIEELNVTKAGSLWAMGQVEVSEPMLLYRTPKSRALWVYGTDPLVNLLMMDKIPEDLVINRSPKGRNNTTRAIIFSKDVAWINLIFPANYSEDISKVLPLAVINVSRRHGVNAYLDGNDVKFWDGTYNKKFCGIISNTTPYSLNIAGMITFMADIELMKEVYNFTHEKFLTKTDAIDIEKYVGGLWEVSTVSQAEFIDEVITEISALLELTPVESFLTPAEEVLLDNAATVINDPLWISDGKLVSE